MPLLKHPTALLASPGPAPFKGHLGMPIGNQNSNGWIALRIGHKESVESAFEQVRRLHALLEELQGEDALHLARAAWDRLLTLPRRDLGENEGADLCALVFTQSQEQATLSGVGIDRVWAWQPDALEVIAGPAHPELSTPGIPKLPPKALVIDSPATHYLGLCHDETEVPRTSKEALHLAGLST